MDADWMALALRLAARGQGRVEPNPMVGAVLVRDGHEVGRGWHRRFAGPHAEAHALKRAGKRARGATLYVTLEPCAHQGKTPPCADAVIASGVRRVVAAMRDPHPLVSGKGFRELRKAGIRVEVGLMEAEARRLNAPFLTLVRSGRPFVTAKWAMTIDGKIATASGDSRWITGEAAREDARRMRGLSDAVVVGAGTVLVDDPLLMPTKPRRMPVRIVVDSKGRTPAGSALAGSARMGPVLVAVTRRAPERKLDALRKAGVEVWVAPSDAGRVDLEALMVELGRRRMTNVFVEGGGRLLGVFFDAGLVDRVVAYVAPRILGGEKAITPVEGMGAPAVGRSTKIRWTSVKRIGTDWRMTGDVARGR